MFMKKFLDSGSAKMSEVINFGSVTENPYTPMKVSEKPGQNLVTFVCNWEVQKERYDVVAWF